MTEEAKGVSQEQEKVKPSLAMSVVTPIISLLVFPAGIPVYLSYLKYRRSMPPTFWVANIMEIFERLAWYGFFAVSSLYLTAPLSEGGLGLTSEQRGVLQGVIPFILYLLPVLTGALADRFGYKKTFFVAYSILTPGYFLLGQPSGFWGFFFVFLLVAVGAATFKPVVVGTVSRVTSEKSKSMAFGIFYMMVNIGGAYGPIVAGIVRNELGWPWVFRMSAIWIGINFIWLLLFYKEPPTVKSDADEGEGEPGLGLAPDIVTRLRNALAPLVRLGPAAAVLGFFHGWFYASIGLVVVAGLLPIFGLTIGLLPAEVRDKIRGAGGDVVSVLGNGSFFLTVFGTLFALMLVGGDWVTWTETGWLVAAVIGGNLIIDVIIRSLRPTETEVSVESGTYRKAKIKEKQVPAPIRGLWEPMRIGDWRFLLYLLLLSGFWTEFNQIFITMPEYIRDFTNTDDILASVSWVCSIVGIDSWAAHIDELAAGDWTVNPEWIINVDAYAIIVFQVIISAAFAKFRPFTTMILGTLLTGVGLILGVWGGAGWIVVASIAVFAVGEMMASPKSQEYVSRIAPEGKTAMYMGFYFVAIALGNLFGGLLSGQAYGKLARDMQRPDLMWALFAALAVLTAFLLFLYDRLVIRRMPKKEIEE